MQETFLKAAHAQRQEAAQVKKDEKRRAEKDRIMNEEDPDKQRRLEVTKSLFLLFLVFFKFKLSFYWIYIKFYWSKFTFMYHTNIGSRPVKITKGQ